MTKNLRNFFDPPFGGRPPSEQAVHSSTMRYLQADALKNGHKYSKEDAERIGALLNWDADDMRSRNRAR